MFYLILSFSGTCTDNAMIVNASVFCVHLFPKAITVLQDRKNEFAYARISVSESVTALSWPTPEHAPFALMGYTNSLPTTATATTTTRGGTVDHWPVRRALRWGGT